MTIQHRNLPDSELHEVKGSTTASTGSVLVSNGVGGTSFSKLGVANFTGSVPDSVPDIVLATDGVGGFKIRQQALGLFHAVRYGLSSAPGSIEILADIAPIGMYLTDGGLKVSQNGYYLFMFQDYASIISGDPETPATKVVPSLKNQFSNTIFSGLSGAVYLNAADTYYIGNNLVPETTLRFSVVRYDL